MKTRTANFFTCTAGHHVELPYPSGQYSSWCDPCGKQMIFNPVPRALQTPEQQQRASEDIRLVMERKFKDYADTYDKAREGIPTPLVATAKDEKQAALISRLRAGKFPERHIAALPIMDKTGMATAREVDEVLNARPGPATCLLWGDYGRGKTQIAAGVAMLRAQRNERTRYVNAVDFIRELKDNFEAKIPESAILRKYHEHPCLVIDDLHAALDDDPGAVRWARGQFQNLMDIRYRTNLPLKTLILANATDMTLLNSRIGGHILSRVMEDGKIIHVNSKNYRKK